MPATTRPDGTAASGSETTPPRRRSRRTVVLTAAMLGIAGALLIAACGGGSDDGGDAAATAAEGGGTATAAAGGEESDRVIRFVQAPDPVWEYMLDQGIIQEMEEESGITIQTDNTFDYFSIFAGGHADVVSANSYQTPLFDTRGIPTVTFGKYNASKDLLVTANPDWKTAADLPKGCKIAAETFTGNVIVFSSLIEKLHGREVAEGSDDLPLIQSDFQIMPTLLESGDACAGIADPTQVTTALREGKIHPMYDGKSASQIYGEMIVPGHFGVDTNDFVAKKDWYEEHPEEVAFFLKVWERGLELWHENPDAIIEAQPEGFAIQNEADEAFIKDYIRNTFDFFQDTVYLDADWIRGEQGVFDLIQAAGVVPEDQPYNEQAVIDPATGQETERLGGEGS